MSVQLPRKVAEKGINAEHARAINQLIEAVRKVQLVAGPGQRIVQTPNGTTLKVEQEVKPATVTTARESWFY